MCRSRSPQFFRSLSRVFCFSDAEVNSTIDYASRENTQSNKWRCHVERSETSLVIPVAVSL